MHIPSQSSSSRAPRASAFRVRALHRRATRAIVAVALVAFAAGAAPAAAQGPAQTPEKGLVGYGVDVGVLFPDEAFENAIALEGHGEYYLSPRVALRGIFGFANPGFTGLTENHFRQFKLLFGGTYNWNYRSLRPFAGAGAGFYFVREHLDGAPDPPGETRGGLHFGGGTEYLMSDQDAMKFELRWDVVSHPNLSPDATGLTLTVGYKRFF